MSDPLQITEIEARIDHVGFVDARAIANAALNALRWAIEVLDDVDLRASRGQRVLENGVPLDHILEPLTKTRLT